MKYFHIYFWNPLDLNNWAVGIDRLTYTKQWWVSVGPITLRVGRGFR